MNLLRKYIREILEKEGTLNGTVDLYHFCTTSACYMKPETMVIDPQQMSSYEKQRSVVPRSYFYPFTPQHALQDKWTIRDGVLYHVAFPGNRIYDTTGKKDQWANEFGYLDQDRMFNDIKERYPAAFIPGSPFPVVVLFEPVTAHLVDDSTKEKLMRGEKAA